MQLVINSYGAYLKKKNNRFEIKNDDKKFEVSVNKVDSILIATSAYLSTDAIKFACDNNIDIVFLDHFGDPYGRVWHSKLGSTTLIRRRQLELYDTKKGFNMAKTWGVRKIDNQMEFCKSLKRARKKDAEKLSKAIERLERSKKELESLTGTLDERRQTFLGIEGMASRTYFQVISAIMPSRYAFNGRSRSPAKDEFNCMLNYGYGVLYSMVEKACIISGLDPYIGFFHKDNYNKKSFVFDLIENFRIFVDRTVVHLFTKKQVKEEYFDRIPRGLSLNKEGKAVLIQALNETFESKVKYKGRKIKRRNTITFECHRLANSLIE